MLRHGGKAYVSKRRLATTIVCAILCCDILAESRLVVEESDTFEIQQKKSGSKVALLVALQDGLPGEADLKAWSGFAKSFGVEPPPVWIICTGDKETEDLVNNAHLQPLLASPSRSWAETLATLVADKNNVSAVGLFGEGSLPPSNIPQEMHSLEHALVESDAPTAVLTRSRAKSGDPTTAAGDDNVIDRSWLPDTFVSHMWLSMAMLDTERLEDAELDNDTLLDLPLLDVLPRLIKNYSSYGDILVDGTNILESTFSFGKKERVIPIAEEVRIGSLEFSLVKGDEEETVNIAKAAWPPSYILDNVANEDGLVMVTNVNCGYLDISTNLLLSVERVSDAKLLFIAMDEVAFDFMDALRPGRVAMFAAENSTIQHAAPSGVISDAYFKEMVVIRPLILLGVLLAGHPVLWTDSDMVWLESPLPLLPDIKDPSSADGMIQHDAFASNPCTCFIFLKASEMSIKLVELWRAKIVLVDAAEDQPHFRPALAKQREAGMNIAVIPVEILPAGKIFFDKPYEENYAEVYHNETLVVHNNWIKGHDPKRQRFRDYHLWDVAEMSFPDCSG